jgi:hypothetical protein
VSIVEVCEPGRTRLDAAVRRCPVVGGGPAGSAGAFEWRPGVGVAGCEDGFGLGVAVGLPGEHGELVLFESEVVEAFAGEVVVDGAVGGLGRAAEGPLDVGEDGVGFGEGAEVFGPVVVGEFVVCGLVEADADVSVGLAGGVFDFDSADMR